MKKGYLASIPVIVVLILGLVWLLWARFDTSRPALEITPHLSALGARTVLNVTATDKGAGLKSVEVALIQGGHQAVPLKAEYPDQWLFTGTGVMRRNLEVVIEPRKLGLAQGPVELRVTARDASWWQGFSGNETVLSRTLPIDWQPPRIQVLTSARNLTRGGADLIIYKVSDGTTSGVRIGDRFYPGYPSALGNGAYCCYFAYPVSFEKPPDNLAVVAKDAAGNEAKASFYCHLRDRTFPEAKLELSQQFLSKVAAKLLPAAAAGQPLVNNFLEVNRALRAVDHQRIIQVCSQSSPKQLWKGRFLRLENTARMAGFGDKRTYLYQGRVIDHQRHLGIDLASVAGAPVTAAGGGIVAWADDLGIYGNCVIIDHGQGLFSLYGHLSQISVAAGQDVKQGQIIGHTGSTGLAGGDHLHFSMLVSGTFVNPLEWWDAHWVHDHIDLQYVQAKEMLAPPPALRGPGVPPPDRTGVIR